MLYLSKLESKLDEALSEETRESLTDWIGNKRKKQLNKNKMAEDKTYTKKELKDFVIKLRKKHAKIEEQQFFCNRHNFNLEAEAKRNEAEVVRRIIHEMEQDFDLGFVWDKSLD